MIPRPARIILNTAAFSSLAILSLASVAARAAATASADTPAAAVPGNDAKQVQSASEVLRGNGTRAGYILAHGGLVPSSEWVYIGVKRGRRNEDYTIDYSSGNLFFAEPVPKSESVRVDYQYTETEGRRGTAGVPTLALSFGPNARTNLTYAYRAASESESADVLTYGLRTTYQFGASSTLSSLMYVASPQEATRISLTSRPQAAGKAQKSFKKDHLIVQDAEIKLSNGSVTLNYQDAGLDFAGFQTLRDTGAADAGLLNQLEKEKGLRRFNFGSQLKFGGGTLGLSHNSIEDQQDEILSRSLEFSRPGLQIGHSVREVGSGFTRFKDLRESASAQWAKEAGLRRADSYLKFNPGGGTKESTEVSLKNTELSDAGGEMTIRSASLDLGEVKIEADIRDSAGDFRHISALTAEDRTRMALAARQQFDQRAAPGAIAATELAQIDKEAGLDRRSYRAQYDAGSVWLSLSKSEISDGAADLSRTDCVVEHRSFKLRVASHRIGAGFSRLANLQPTEVRHYGNEHGMNRNEAEADITVGGGKLDLYHTRVADDRGSSLARNKATFKNGRLDFRADFQDIDASFVRIADLSDSDKSLLLRERGFKKADYSLDFAVTPQVRVKTYLYDSTSKTIGHTRNQRKHEVAYNGAGKLSVTALTDDFAGISDTGKMSAYSRRKITFGNTFDLLRGLQVTALSDVNSVNEDESGFVTTRIAQTHFETGQAPLRFSLDTLDTDISDGRFERTWMFGVKSKASQRLNVLGSFSQTDRNLKPEDNGALGIEYVITPDLKLSANMANRRGGPKGNQQIRQFTLNGILAKRFLGLNDLKIGSAVNTTQSSGIKTVCDNGLKLEAGLLGGVFRLDNTDKLNPTNGIHYTSRILRFDQPQEDPGKWYNLSFYRQKLITPANEEARKHNYALSLRVSPAVKATATSYFGKDGQNGSVKPIGGSVFKITWSRSKSSALFADYSSDRNDTVGRSGNTAGIGFTGKLAEADFELYFGYSRLDQSAQSDSRPVCRIKYDRKFDSDRCISFWLEKRSPLEQIPAALNEGNLVAGLDLRTPFH